MITVDIISLLATNQNELHKLIHQAILLTTECGADWYDGESIYTGWVISRNHVMLFALSPLVLDRIDIANMPPQICIWI